MRRLMIGNDNGWHGLSQKDQVPTFGFMRWRLPRAHPSQ
jgi:hypothetical protein